MKKTFSYLCSGIFALLVFCVMGCQVESISPDDYRGRVLDNAGKPLAGIRVSDGFQVVQTKKDGTYHLPPNPKTTILSVVIPADYDTENFWLPVKPDVLDGYDFKLSPRPKKETFSFIHFSDLETGKWSLMEIYEQFRDRIFCEKDAAFVIYTGDLCREDGVKLTGRECVRESFGGLRAYVTIGNHDLIPGYERGEQVFEENCGPTRFAFVEGNVLCIVLPMMYGDANPSYTLEEITAFTKSMLDTWPKGAPVFFFCHFYRPYFDFTSTFAAGASNAFDLSPWKVSGMAYGHTHWYHVYPDVPVPFWNVGQSHGGGGGNMPGATRIFHIDAKGDCTTELCESRVTPVLHGILSPKGQLTVTAFDCRGVCQAVTALVDGQEISLEKQTSWNWSTQLSKPSEKVHIKANFLIAGKTEVREAECAINPASKNLELEQAISLSGKTIFGTPVTDGKRFFVGLEDEANSKLGGICAIDIASGSILWNYTTGFSVRNSLILDNGMLYASDADNNLYKLQAEDGKLVWCNRNACGAPLDCSNHSAPSIGEGLLFSGCTSYLRAVDLESGKTVWTFHDTLGEFGTTQGPLYHDGLVFYAANWGPGCFALEASSGKLVWDSRKEEPTQGYLFQPTLAALEDGTLVRCEGDRGVTLFEQKTGKILRQMETPELMSTSSTPLVYNNTIYCGADTKGFCAIDLNTLKCKWTMQDTIGLALLGTVQYRGQMHTVEASPALERDTLFVAGGDGILYLLNPETGAVIDSFDTGAPLLSKPVIIGDSIYLADYSGRLLVFRWK